MQQYDKNEIKEKLSTDMVFDIVYEFGGEPHMTDFGFISATVCHNAAGEGSHKLYYYENTKLFRCYTGCDSYFDIFELISKVKLLANPAANWGLYDSVRWVASRYGWSPTQAVEVDNTQLADWRVLDRYSKIKAKEAGNKNIDLKDYDPIILSRLCYPRIDDWIKEGMTKEVLDAHQIGYYPVGEQITIPHYDAQGRFIGLRGRALGSEEAEMYGKYRPVFIGGQMYNHPLGLNLYNLNFSTEAIKKTGKAIIFEGEKSCLLYGSYFGMENDISVACCGSSVSSFQVQLLTEAGAKEIIIAFDRQFQERGGAEFKHLTKNLTAINNKFKQYATISFMFDKWDLLPYKASPIDCGKNTFIYLYKNRIFL